MRRVVRWVSIGVASVVGVTVLLAVLGPGSAYGESALTGVVVEGRDITTVVAPDAPVRILLTASPDRVGDCLDGFRSRGLRAEEVGRLDDSGEVRLAYGDRQVTVFDLRTEGVTDLRR